MTAKKKSESTTKKFSIKGMECESCKKIIEKTGKKIKGVLDVRTDYVKGLGQVTYDPEKTSLEEIFKTIDGKGYDCRIIQPKQRNSSFGKTEIMIDVDKIKNVSIILGLLAIVLGGYYILGDRVDFTMPALDQNASFALLFIIGLFTGFHCIAMCGGFVVSYSAKKSDKGINYKSHLTYGISKTFSYAVIGAFFGFIGSLITFTPFIRGAAAILAGTFLVVFGLNMLDLLKWFRRFRLKTPSVVGKFMSGKSDHGPATIGLLNGLMIACGPLQAIYIFAAASGSPYYGALYLTAFGLGTLPVLLGFGVFTSIMSARLTHKIVRYSGMLVIFLGLIMVNRGLALTGTGYDVNSVMIARESIEATGLPGSGSSIELDDEGYQVIKMEVNRYGWDPDKFVLKAGVPVKWIIDGVEINGCNNAIQVPKLNLDFKIKRGLQEITFTPENEGVIPWSCWMGMIPGAFVVKDNINVNNIAQVAKELEEVELASGGSCGGNCGGAGCGCGCGGGG